jgi:hypothetical protein
MQQTSRDSSTVSIKTMRTDIKSARKDADDDISAHPLLKGPAHGKQGHEKKTTLFIQLCYSEPRCGISSLFSDYVKHLLLSS